MSVVQIYAHYSRLAGTVGTQVTAAAPGRYFTDVVHHSEEFSTAVLELREKIPECVLCCACW